MSAPSTVKSRRAITKRNAAQILPIYTGKTGADKSHCQPTVCWHYVAFMDGRENINVQQMVALFCWWFTVLNLFPILKKECTRSPKVAHYQMFFWCYAKVITFMVKFVLHFWWDWIITFCG